MPNGVSSVPEGTEYLFEVVQDPSDGDYTGFSLYRWGGNTTFLFSPLADEGVRTFVVSPNDSISMQPISEHHYSELSAGNTYSFANQSQFYLGFYTGNSYPQNGIYNDPLFGWGQFENNNGTIRLLGGALEYGGGGIYAGTETIIPVPEPSTISLAVCGFAFLLFCRRKMRSTES